MKTQSRQYALYNFKWVIIILVVFALLSGGSVYILWRPSTPVFFQWLHFFGLERWIDLVRLKFFWYGQFLPEWFLYSLPGGLWSFAYSILITNIWWRNKSYIKYFWFSTIPLLVIDWEVFQFFGIIPGTFSFGDVIMGFIGILSGIFIGIKLKKPKYHEKNSL